VQEGKDTLSKSASFSRQSSAPNLFAPEVEDAREKPRVGASWKDEVNQRLAAHRSQRGTTVEEQHRGQPSPHLATNSRAAQAAARVAARYAQAPTYSELLAGEARAVVHAASAAVEAARDAQAAAEAVLAGLQSRLPEAATPPTNKQPSAAEYTHRETPPPATARWQDEEPSGTETNLPQTAAQPRWEEALPSAVASDRDVWQEMRVYPSPTPEYEYEHATYAVELFPEDAMASATVEPVQSTAANLIEFPRELIAARKARPRLAEGPFALRAPDNPQLSIFEVDPAMLAAPVQISVAPPEWASIELEDSEPSVEESEVYRATNRPAQSEPQIELGPLDHHNFFEADTSAFEEEPAVASATDRFGYGRNQTYSYAGGYANSGYSIASQPEESPTVADFAEQPRTASALPQAVEPSASAAVTENLELFVAAKSDRLLAAIVDGALVTLAYLAAATMVIASTDHPPSGIVALQATAIGLVLFTILYLAIFFGFSAEGTPGMRYARIALCTFDDNNPTMAQTLWRIPAFLLAAMPAGLGLAWALVDGDGLGLHDKLSKTYQRKY